jgi:hypothetical protein
MSVRRRAIRDRLEREGMRRAEYARMKAAIEAIQAMCKRKILAGESNVTAEELSACFSEQHSEKP